MHLPSRLFAALFGVVTLVGTVVVGIEQPTLSQPAAEPLRDPTQYVSRQHVLRLRRNGKVYRLARNNGKR